MSSIPSIVTPIWMSLFRVFADWFSLSCTVLSNAASLFGMSSLNRYPNTYTKSPTHLVRSLRSHSITNFEPFVHAGVVTLVQRGSCSCHHQNVVHLGAECTSLAVEGCVESRCRRCFCLRQLILIPLIHDSEVRSQFERPIRVRHRISVELVWLADHPCADHSDPHALSWRACHALHLPCETFCFLCEYCHRRLLLL